MTAEIHPPELAQLVDFAERPRRDDWSLRAALTRYAQPEPNRVGDLLEVVRWLEFGLRPHLKTVQRDGPALWDELRSGGGTGEPVVELLRIMVELDRLGDVLADWASDISQPRPDATVDEVTARVARRLHDLGVPREQRQRPTRARG